MSTENAPTPVKDTPDSPDQRLHDQGVAFLENGQIDDAIESFRRALMHKTDRPVTRFMLGNCYKERGEFEKAVDHYQVAGMLAPRYTKCWVALAVARLNMERNLEALSAIRQARKHAEDPHEFSLIQTLAMCLSTLEEPDINPQLVEDMTRCFQTPGIENRKLVHIAQNMLLHQFIVKKLLEHHSAAGFRDFDMLLQEKSLNWTVLNHALFIRVMSDFTLWREDLEKLFHGLRLTLLKKAQQRTLDDAALWPEALKFIAALAQQCFTNEYVYDISDKELEMLVPLEARAAEHLAPYDIALLACYKPLSESACLQPILDHPELMQDDVLAPVLKTQVSEPLEEREILKTLTRLSAIEDEVSIKVKGQYEVFPYPRWVSTAVHGECSFRRMLEIKFPHVEDAQLPADDFCPEVLIAGCGTGRQSVEWSMLIPNTHNLAVDITANSLAYAIRKTREAERDNIEYAQADILKLREIDRHFDVIQCGGVLHHMRDPMEGWRVLTDILKPGGFMMIGLYSEIARRPIVAAREYISQQGIPNTAEGIRTLRAHIRGLPDDHVMKEIWCTQDFYSLSECRDLLFHVQEHRFTALDLKKCIETLNLEFLGFQGPPTPSVLAHYKALFPDDPYALDLEKWHAYELENPAIFKGMYQFWLRKPG